MHSPPLREASRDAHRAADSAAVAHPAVVAGMDHAQTVIPHKDQVAREDMVSADHAADQDVQALAQARLARPVVVERHIWNMPHHAAPTAALFLLCPQMACASFRLAALKKSDAT